MRPSTRKQLLWQALGVLCYLGGMLLFVVIALDVYFSPPERSIENLSTVHVPFLLVSLVLFVLGGYVNHRFGGGIGGLRPGPDRPQSRREAMLSEYGLNDPEFEDEPDGEPEYAYEDGETYVRCSNCGTKNEPEFDYCGECAAEL